MFLYLCGIALGPVTTVIRLLHAQGESARQGDDHTYPAAPAADIAHNRLPTAAAEYPLRLNASGYMGSYCFLIVF